MELGRTPSFKKRKRSKLGLLPLVALIFYEVSGGPLRHRGAASHIKGMARIKTCSAALSSEECMPSIPPGLVGMS